ncbi:WD40 repeat-like protein [Stereum hirsutum FP-91666 SS1]|uniref:WD40 repeat-like protein n=1 Tax=Stereum hirsutum (strain FP-91666) TaxID=721885 RepID=UPI0004409E89|nr:WD40 repeat-like protein [Stereum hirsutum FP-91666 SS1]EIM88259.1 WD40 repeat-like protein [Stereum hirsutum FP-91666 SS1]
MTEASVEYIAASANRFHHAAVNDSSSLIVYGSGKFVALWDTEDPSDRGVYSTLVGHTGLVTCLKFIDGPQGRLVSADDTGNVRIWRREGTKFKSTLNVQAHSKSISALGYHEGCLVTGASDSSIKVWQLGPDDDLKEVQTISLKNKYPLSVELDFLPGTKARVLAIGTTSPSIQIYTRSEDQFVLSATLSGHEDWVRSLSFRPPLTSQDSAVRSDPLILASGAQDSTIRLWNIEPFSAQKSDRPDNQGKPQLTDELLDAFEASLGESNAEEGGRQISLKKHVLTITGDDGSPQQFSVTFDALLVGHEAGVTSLSWRPDLSSSSSTNGSSPPLTLLSTSTDSSLILWSPSPILTTPNQPTETTTIWVNRQRFGDVGGQRLGGFVGGIWARSGKEALAWGWAGGWRRWRADESSGAGGAAEMWTEVGAVTGHAGPVRGISWAPNGEYLASTGIDQTTRIHGAIPSLLPAGTKAVAWHELARPQVHGYDLVGVAFIDVLKLVSVADEKVARVFEGPRAFVKTVKGLDVADLGVDEADRPVGASVPPLGLSNKATNDTNAQPFTFDGEDEHLRRPFEGELAAMTLWPEIEKVFGHGYESITVSISNSRKLMATACRATTAKHAVVRLYDTEKFHSVGEPLEGHALTVTRIAFSPDDRHVLTVSRDRTWRLFRVKEEGVGYVPVAADKSHTRIIWDCSWSPQGDIFATASRDKTVKIWTLKETTDAEKWTATATIKLKEAATAVAFGKDHDSQRVLAVGLETGHIHIYTGATPANWTLSTIVNPGMAHIDQIYQMAWRPDVGENEELRHLASCSEDGTLRILSIRLGRG